jgi:hypothetical protein
MSTSDKRVANITFGKFGVLVEEPKKIYRRDVDRLRLLLAAPASTGDGGRRIRRDITEVEKTKKGRVADEKEASGAKAAVFAASPAAANLAPLAVNVPAAVEMELAGRVCLSRSWANRGYGRMTPRATNARPRDQHGNSGDGGSARYEKEKGERGIGNTFSTR